VIPFLAAGGWVTRIPSDDRQWQPDVAQVAWAEQHPQLRLGQDRRVKIGDLRCIDLFVSHWGSPWIAHTLVNFDFGENRYLTASIEARKEI